MDIQDSQSYISIVVDGKAPGIGVLLNGDSLGDLVWGTINDYAIAEKAIDQDTYVMESVNSRPFVVYVYSHWLVDCSYYDNCPANGVGVNGVGVVLDIWPPCSTHQLLVILVKISSKYSAPADQDSMNDPSIYFHCFQTELRKEGKNLYS